MRRFSSLFLLCFFSLSIFTTSAHANNKYSALVIHADTGDVLFDKYSKKKRYPASLTKMMTLYMLFEELEAGRITLDTKLKASSYAASMPASDLGLKAGDTLTVETAIRALVIKSANDVAVVVAEKLGKSEKNFAKKMTNKAWSMGMRSTQFRNASGLPNKKQYSTARDLAILSKRVMQDFPQYWSYFQETSFKYKNKTYKSHNKLVGNFKGADGLKTGYTRMSGYNLATSVNRGDNRLIGIVLGGRSGKTRDAHMRKILDQAYRNIAKKPHLVSYVHRRTPSPSIKPTVLASLGGSWPSEEMKKKSLEDLVIDEVENTEINKTYTLADYKAADPISRLSKENITEAERLNILTLAAANAQKPYAEGDTDDRTNNIDLSWGIQIGAYRSNKIAKEKLKVAQKNFGSLIADAPSSISKTKKKGRTYFRLRFTSMTEAQAKQTCSSIIKKGGDCFKVKEAK